MTTVAPYDLFTADDDFLHEFSTHPWHTETWWFSFFVPEHGLGGWLYGLARPNQRTSNGGLWIWAPESSEPRTSPYFAHYTSLPTRIERLRENPQLWPSSFTVAVREPGQRYGLSYVDEAAGLRLELDFAATTPAIGHAAKEPPFLESAHFDQAGRVTGTLVLEGKTVPVDCYAVRDRSWGLRSERVSPKFSYCWLASAEESWLVYGQRDTSGSLDVEVTRGFLYRGGEAQPIVSGRRAETRDPAMHWVTCLDISAVDVAGRTIEATGRAVSRIVHPRAIAANTIALLDFGPQGWGEDQDVWSHLEWKSALRHWAR